MIINQRKRTQCSFKHTKLLIKLCNTHSVQWRPNIEVVVTFVAHTSNSLARSLPPSVPLSLLDYSHIHSRINLGLHSLIHTLLRSLIHSHNCTHLLAHLIVHAFHHSPIDLLVHSFLRSKIPSLTQLFTPSRNNPIIHSLPPLVLVFTHYPIIHTFT